MNGKIFPQWQAPLLNHSGMPEGGEVDWLRKPVLADRPLFPGEGILSLAGSFLPESRPEEGLLVFPLVLEKKNPSNRAYGFAGFRISLPETEDITSYNRISLQLRVEGEGLDGVFVEISLHNTGEHIVPVPGRFEGTHSLPLAAGFDRDVVWEFPDLPRDACTGFTISVAILGKHTLMGETGKLYLRNLRLQTVVPEKSRGFAVAEGKIACSHSGYGALGEKRAVADGKETAFSLEDEQCVTVYTGVGTPTPHGVKLDFSAFTREGRYRIRCGQLVSPYFSIGREAFLSAGQKLISFYHTQRCGFDLPGIHPPCHLDAYCVHPDGRRVSVAGGWHDAADVTQGVMNTAEGALALLTLARDPRLTQAALEEARWGLQWMMGTRFGDGYRYGGNIMGIWTENYMGDGDDMFVNAQNRPYDNFLSASACAEAVPRFGQDKAFAARLRCCAIEDFAFAAAKVDEPQKQAAYPELFGMAASAACRLYRLTGEEVYLEKAAVYAGKVLDCQQQTPLSETDIPLSGFFWETPDKQRTLNYYHRSGEYTLTECLAMLLETAPHHPDSILWRQGLALYAGYIHTIAGYMEPWGLLPNGLYQPDNTDYSGLYHEGARVGLPTIEEYNAQVYNGIPMGGGWYLRRFPVAYQFRGFFGTLLGKAAAAAYAAKALDDSALLDIALRQSAYVVGLNPFTISFMFGEGYGYPPLYGALTGQPVGGVPVGIETLGNEDEPYMPMQINCTYKEIWMHTASRMAEMTALQLER